MLVVHARVHTRVCMAVPTSPAGTGVGTDIAGPGVWAGTGMGANIAGPVVCIIHKKMTKSKKRQRIHKKMTKSKKRQRAKLYGFDLDLPEQVHHFLLSQLWPPFVFLHFRVLELLQRWRRKPAEYPYETPIDSGLKCNFPYRQLHARL